MFSNFFFPFLIAGLKEKMLQIITANPEGHFFLDEVPLAELKITPKDLEEISNAIPAENFFWFACQSQLLPQQLEQELKDCGNTQRIRGLGKNYDEKVIANK